ncbi:hypothetical protein NLM27_25925 [Bradyrhizobium sp. CCGB12]|uniref:hypothetical protein n=1 Tax=Bradyrhizobium sp. CCGB12 TaxID=2949632 RepID=UPI0020B30181|nr:hypothetical protein [Bradyrhizobium sp. CCGB12]MCP3392220.1 hypothetical protein [Bradyrhizobium sp. CCGB12]
MRFRFIEDRRAHYPVMLLCEVVGVSPAGYYACARARRADDLLPTETSSTKSNESIATPAAVIAARASMSS